MSSKLGVQNIAHTNGTNAMTISSGGATTFTTDPFNSVVETWYYNTSNDSHSNDSVMNKGYSRYTTNNTANKNGGMSHASSAGTDGTGIWTFPSTGIWRIELVFSFYFSGGASLASGVRMEVTTNNSNYYGVSGGRTNAHITNSNDIIILPYTLNVDNVSNVKFRHVVNTLGNAIIIRGGSPSTDVFGTLIHFIKLCPSV